MADHPFDPWTRVRTIHDLPADEVISCLQKSIRRGMVENACLVAYEMMHTSPELERYMWDRLSIISVEDIGFGDAKNENHKKRIRSFGRLHHLIYPIRRPEMVLTDQGDKKTVP